VFLESGQVPIHNNQAENKIRPFVIGRNYVHNRIMCTSILTFDKPAARIGFSSILAVLTVNIIKGFPGMLASSHQAFDRPFLSED
jgi:hypothetical protein